MNLTKIPNTAVSPPLTTTRRVPHAFLSRKSGTWLPSYFLGPSGNHGSDRSADTGCRYPHRFQPVRCSSGLLMDSSHGVRSVRGKQRWLRSPFVARRDGCTSRGRWLEACWNSDCFVQVRSHSSCHRADPFLTYIRWPTGTRSRTEIASSLFRQHLRHRCGSLPVADPFFPAGTSLRPSVRQALPGNVQYNTMHQPRAMLP